MYVVATVDDFSVYEYADREKEGGNKAINARGWKWLSGLFLTIRLLHSDGNG
jgi:hypothetical protein